MTIIIIHKLLSLTLDFETIPNGNSDPMANNCTLPATNRTPQAYY